MKINKKFATAGLLTMTAFASLSLTSCSQGSNPNLNAKYSLTINGHKYYVNDRGQIQIKTTSADGKTTTYENLPDLKQYQKFDKDGKPTPENVEEMKTKEEIVAEANAGLLVSNYIRYTVDQYLYLLTSSAFMKTDTVKNLTDKVQKEFLLAYHLGFGEGTDTYRLRITDISFTMSDLIKDNWAWGTDLPASDLKDASDTDKTQVPNFDVINNVPNISVSNVKLTFGYYKSNGGTSISDITDFNTLKNSNWSSYWRNFIDKGDKLTNFQYTMNINKPLSFKIKPALSYYIEHADKNVAGSKDTAKYYYTGSMQIDGFDPKAQNLAAQINSWPFWYDGLKYWGKPINAEGKIEDKAPDAVQTISESNKYFAQTQFNNQINKTTNKLEENKISLEDLKTKDQYKNVYDSINGANFFDTLAGIPPKSDSSTPRR